MLVKCSGFWNMLYREKMSQCWFLVTQNTVCVFSLHTGVSEGDKQALKPHYVTMLSEANSHPDGTSSSVYCTLFCMLAFLGPFAWNSPSKGSDKEKMNEGIERGHGVGFKGGGRFLRVWGWKGDTCWRLITVRWMPFTFNCWGMLRSYRSVWS